jgi:hypothetical protein
VIRALERHGLLLKQDKVLPSVVGLVTGESLKGSWWSHPEARKIFAVMTDLDDDEDVLLTKLIAGKDTLVHRRLWPALVAVGRSGEAWQRNGLTLPAKRLMESVERSKSGVEAAGTPARELALRLLAVSSERHSESGRHVRVLESWKSWAARKGVVPLSSAREGRRALEEAAASLGAAPSSLPWAPR